MRSVSLRPCRRRARPWRGTVSHPWLHKPGASEAWPTLNRQTKCCWYQFQTADYRSKMKTKCCHRRRNRSRARYCEYTVANAPKMVRMRLNKLPWSHFATWIDVGLPCVFCSFLLVHSVIGLVWSMIQSDLYFTTGEVMFTSADSDVYMTIFQLSGSPLKSLLGSQHHHHQ